MIFPNFESPEIAEQKRFKMLGINLDTMKEFPIGTPVIIETGVCQHELGNVIGYGYNSWQELILQVNVIDPLIDSDIKSIFTHSSNVRK